MRNLSLAAPLLCIFFAWGCAPESSSARPEEETGTSAQPEPWSPRDDPALFSLTLERRASELPRSGEVVPIPWPGYYWPTWQDSINYRWAGPTSESPAKKYEAAFRLAGVEDAVSRHHGIDAVPLAKACTQRSDCDNGNACAKREGATTGRCIPTWYGVCHGWAAAALLFPEPKHEVVIEGVTFKVQDIRALISLAHNTTMARYLSERCNDSDSKGTIKYDEHGRPPRGCRDTNAGTFHIILGNHVGIHKHSVIVDRVFDDQVWNYPIRSYKIVEERPVTVEEAHALLGVQPPPIEPTPLPDGGTPDADAGPAAPPTYFFNPAAAAFAHMKTDVATITGASSGTDGELSSRIDSYTLVTRYEYVLELDADGVIVGGEWVGRSKRNHPDFLWVPFDVGTRTVAGGMISYANVKKIALAAAAPEPAATPTVTAPASPTTPPTTTTTPAGPTPPPNVRAPVSPIWPP